MVFLVTIRPVSQLETIAGSRAMIMNCSPISTTSPWRIAPREKGRGSCARTRSKKVMSGIMPPAVFSDHPILANTHSLILFLFAYIILQILKTKLFKLQFNLRITLNIAIIVDELKIVIFD